MKHMKIMKDSFSKRESSWLFMFFMVRAL